MPRGERDNSIWESTQSRFNVQDAEKEVQKWKASLPEIPSVYEDFSYVGLAALHAALREAVQGDEPEMAARLALPLYSSAQPQTINPDITEGVGVLNLIGSSSELDRTGNLFNHGLALLKMVQAVTAFSMSVRPMIGISRTWGGYDVKTSIFKMVVPEDISKRCGEMLNTYPVQSIQMQYDQDNRGSGFEKPYTLQLSAVLRHGSFRGFHDSPLISRFATVFAARPNGSPYKRAIADVSTGVIEHGVFGSVDSYGQLRNLHGFAQAIDLITQQRTT